MFGGEVPDIYTPGEPAPGTSCADAAIVDLDTLHSGTFPGTPSSAWWQFIAPADGQFHVTATGVNNTTSHLRVYDIVFCPIIADITLHPDGPTCFGFSCLAGNPYAVVFFSDAGGEAYTFTVSAGPC